MCAPVIAPTTAAATTAPPATGPRVQAEQRTVSFDLSGKAVYMVGIGGSAIAGLDPTVIVGATCGQLQHGALGTRHAPPGGLVPVTGFRLGSDLIPRGGLAGRPGLLIAEACEFNRSFHNYHPMVASISSVEAD